MANILKVVNKVNLITVYRGEKGDPGLSDAALPLLTASENISALRMVSIVDSQYKYADHLDSSVVGLALQAVNLGSFLRPVRNSVVSDDSWNWARGSPIFLGLEGMLTQIVPLNGFLITVASVLDSKTIFLQIEDAIKL